MSKLVDKERLAKLASALDSRAKAAVKAEEQRALAAEARIEGIANANAQAIAAIKHETTGILAQSKEYTNSKVTEVNSANEELKRKVATLEASDADQTGKITALETKATAHDNSITANTAAIDKLNGADTVDGSVAKTVKDAVEPLKASVSTLNDKIGEEKKGEAAATGLYKKIADGDNATLEAAKKHAEAKIAALVDSAPAAMDTLKELADAITNNKNVYDAYVAQVAEQMEGKVDKAEGSRLITETEAAKYAAKAEVSQVESAKQEAKTYADGKIAPVSAKVTTLEGTVDTIETDIAGLKAKDVEHDTAITDAKAKAEKGISDAAAVAARATTLENLVGTKESGATGATGLCKEISDNKKAISELQSANDQILTNAKAYTNEKIEEVNGTISGVNADVTRLKATVGSSTSGLVKDVADLQTKDGELSRLITANAAAITTLNGSATTEGSVAKKISDALASYSDTEEMKRILGNVVNSLRLSIADNKIKLSLGSGADGITVTETTLDLATDDDIAAIISSLDAPKGYRY